MQQWLAAPLPLGYREYMTTLGEGTYCDFVRVLTPANIRETRDNRRESVREHYGQFWGESENDLGLEEAEAGVFFANTIDGDEIYYLPTQERLFALPRHADVLFWLEAGFMEPLDWTTPSGREYVTQPPFRYFEPAGQDRRVIEFFTAGTFEMRVLAGQLQARWSTNEVRSIPEDSCVILFPRAIKGRVQLAQASNDPRVAIRVDYDNDSSVEVELLASDLRKKGFYETWRHPSPE